MTEPAFRGTLLLLQNRTRRDPDSYKEEFLAQLEHFKASSSTVVAHRSNNPQYIAVLNYLCHVCHCFPHESQIVASIVLELLRTNRDTISVELRGALVKALMMLRSKSIISTETTFPLLFKLLQEKDKSMRQQILSHIVSDIRRINSRSVKGGVAINRHAQNFLFSVMDEDDPIQAKCAELIMVDLYRRRVWCDERTVEVMTRACFSKHTSIIRMALRFFLLQMPKLTSMHEESDEDDQDPGRYISKLKQKLKIVKKTSKRDRVLKRNVRDFKRKYNKEEQEAEYFAKQHADPIRLLRDPQQFVEKLVAKLQKTSERFEIRILYLNVIARTITEHEVVHLPLYSFLERYMEPSQLHSTQLLALSSMCVHRLVPPDAVEPLVKAVANHFVTDRSTPDAITVGLNTIREMCKRQPLAMDADLLKDLVEYKNQRGDKGVIMAARALLQLYREVYPELLPPKLRGSTVGPSDNTVKPVYGAETVYSEIPGLELLCNDASSDDSENDSGESDSHSGEWVTDSDSDLDSEEFEGSFVTVSTEEEGGDEEAESESDGEKSDSCPLLVPPELAPPQKKRRTEKASLQVYQKGSTVSPSNESDDVKDPSEEEDNENNATAMHSPVNNASSEWYEALGDNREWQSASSSAPKKQGQSLSSSKILTDADFDKIRALREGVHGKTKRCKQKDKNAREKKRNDLLYSVSNDLSAADLEHFTQRKRESDKQERMERAQELRKARSKFELGKKKKSKLNSTHVEHSKRGKLFQMTKRSQRVGTKLKSSVSDRANRAKEMKKKDIKFRIKRGWKA